MRIKCAENKAGIVDQSDSEIFNRVRKRLVPKKSIESTANPAIINTVNSVAITIDKGYKTPFLKIIITLRSIYI